MSVQIITFVISFLGLLMAVLLGTQAGEANFVILALWVGGAGVLACLLILKQRIWLLLPLAWPLTNGSVLFPGQLSYQLLTIAVVGTAFIAFHAMHMVKFERPFTTTDLFIVLNLLWLGWAYVRNPAGILLFKTDIIGGAPYLEIAGVAIAVIVLASTRATPGQIKWLVLAPIIPGILFALSTLILYFLPSAGYYSDFIYAGLSPYSTGAIDAVRELSVGETIRFGSLRLLGGMLPLLVVALVPTSRILNPFTPWPYLAAFGVALLMLSGFRSFLVLLIFSCVIILCLRKATPILIISAVLGLFVYATLAFGNKTLFDLPFPVQRALSFLPGNWDSHITQDAEGSVTWRVEMWQEVIGRGRYIKNHIMGDGIGYLAAEQSRTEMMMQMAALGAGSAQMAYQEHMMVSGTFHSGPLSTVRCVGIVGLVLFNILMFFVAKDAWKLVRQAEGSSLSGLAMIIAVPIMIQPLVFWVVYGHYPDDIQGTLWDAACVHLCLQTVKEQRKRSAPSSLDHPASSSTGQPNKAGTVL